MNAAEAGDEALPRTPAACSQTKERSLRTTASHLSSPVHRTAPNRRSSAMLSQSPPMRRSLVDPERNSAQLEYNEPQKVAAPEAIRTMTALTNGAQRAGSVTCSDFAAECHPSDHAESFSAENATETVRARRRSSVHRGAVAPITPLPLPTFARAQHALSASGNATTEASAVDAQASAAMRQLGTSSALPENSASTMEGVTASQAQMKGTRERSASLSPGRHTMHPGRGSASPAPAHRPVAAFAMAPIDSVASPEQVYRARCASPTASSPGSFVNATDIEGQIFQLEQTLEWDPKLATIPSDDNGALAENADAIRAGSCGQEAANGQVGNLDCAADAAQQPAVVSDSSSVAMPSCAAPVELAPSAAAAAASLVPDSGQATTANAKLARPSRPRSPLSAAGASDQQARRSRSRSPSDATNAIDGSFHALERSQTATEMLLSVRRAPAASTSVAYDGYDAHALRLADPKRAPAAVDETIMPPAHASGTPMPHHTLYAAAAPGGERQPGPGGAPGGVSSRLSRTEALRTRIERLRAMRAGALPVCPSPSRIEAVGAAGDRSSTVQHEMCEDRHRTGRSTSRAAPSPPLEQDVSGYGLPGNAAVATASATISAGVVSTRQTHSPARMQVEPLQNATELQATGTNSVLKPSPNKAWATLGHARSSPSRYRIVIATTPQSSKRVRGASPSPETLKSRMDQRASPNCVPASLKQPTAVDTTSLTPVSATPSRTAVKPLVDLNGNPSPRQAPVDAEAPLDVQDAYRQRREEKRRRILEHQRRLALETERQQARLAPLRQQQVVASGLLKSHGTKPASQIAAAAAAAAAAADEAPAEYPLTPERHHSADASDDESAAVPAAKRHLIPEWARSHRLYGALIEQTRVDPDTIFPRVHTCDLVDIFGGGTNRPRYRRRTSSGDWVRDRLTWREEAAYRKALGFDP